MTIRFIQIAYILVTLVVTSSLQANELFAQPHNELSTQPHNELSAQQHDMLASEMSHMMPRSPLTEAGNDVFGTLQEAIRALNDDTTTDWRKVDLEVLRQHLLDMQDMTINVKIVSRQNVSGGLDVVIVPTTARATEALKRVLADHPKQLQQETGWRMQVIKQNTQYRLTITTEQTQEIDKIRGLGYIGLMAFGDHHQAHHWAMAKGINPH